MSLVKYIGPYAAVTVPSAGGVTCEKGKSIEVTEEEAASLLMAPDSWEAGDEETKEIVPHFPTAISLINGFGGAFDATQVYSSGVIVLEGGYEYLSVKASLGETPSEAPTYWQRLGIISREGIEDQVAATQAEASEPNLTLGRDAGAALKGKSETNTLYGILAGKSLTTGKQNTAIGAFALEQATTGSNTAVGNTAGGLITTGTQNTAVGDGALRVNETANNNTAVGVEALRATTAGSNTAVGYRAAFAITTGHNNVAVGYKALSVATTGIENVAIGTEAGEAAEGENNIFIGPGAGRNEKGSKKLYIASNEAVPIIKGFMSSTEAEQEIGFLGSSGSKRVKLASAGSVTAAELRAALIAFGLAE